MSVADDSAPDRQCPTMADGPVLAHLPSEAVERFLAAGRRKVWRRGQFVVRRGDRIDDAMVVLEGRLRASTITPDGEENLLGWLREHELFGAPNVLSGIPFAIDIVADGRAVTLHVAREDFLRVLLEVPAAAIAIAKVFGHRLARLYELINASGHRSLTDRVRAHLLRLAVQHGHAAERGGIALDITQGDLAAAVGASRQRVHAELRRLQDQGAIELTYRRIVVRSLPAEPSADPDLEGLRRCLLRLKRAPFSRRSAAAARTRRTSRASPGWPSPRG